MSVEEIIKAFFMLSFGDKIKEPADLTMLRQTVNIII